MRTTAAILAVMGVGMGLSGCAVVSVATTAVDVTTTVVGTTVDAGSAVVRTATGSGNEDEQKKPDR